MSAGNVEAVRPPLKVGPLGDRDAHVTAESESTVIGGAARGTRLRGVWLLVECVIVGVGPVLTLASLIPSWCGR